MSINYYFLLKCHISMANVSFTKQEYSTSASISIFIRYSLSTNGFNKTKTNSELIFKNLIIVVVNVTI